MVHGHDIPVLSYFIYGKEAGNDNIFTGSEGNNFRYRLSMVEDKIVAHVWYEDLCFECATQTESESFPATDEGLGEAVDYIFSKKK